MSNQIEMQGNLGVDKKNRWFTDYRQNNALYVYFGMALYVLSNVETIQRFSQ